MKEKRLFLTSLKQICNECLIKFSENQSAPRLENRKTSPCSPCAPNLLHVLVSQIPGYHNLCSPVCILNYEKHYFLNIDKGTTDPVEFISQVLTQILMKFHLLNLVQPSTKKSQTKISISTKLKLQNIDQI